MKTVEQHLADLAEPARSLALKNMWWEDRNSLYELQSDALKNAFNWSRSPERTFYWFEVYTEIEAKEKKLPAAPKNR